MKQKSSTPNQDQASPVSGQAPDTDWKVYEAEIEKASDKSTGSRLNSAPSASYVDEFSKLGIVLPSLTSTAARSEHLSPEAKSLSAMLESDGINGLKARASYSCQKSDLKRLYTRVLGDETLAPGTRDGMLEALRGHMKAARAEYEGKIAESPESFMAAKVADLRAYRRQYNRGRIVQTEYVQEKKEEIIEALRGSRMCFISGETGTGKTEVARIVAREFSERKELLVRGYAGISSAELYGHMTLSDSSEKRSETLHNDIEMAEKVYKEKYPNAKPKDLEEVARSVLAKAGVTTTEYILGAVYQAAKEGRVCIIDEANYIPPELLASLNDIMTKRSGELIHVQQDGVGPITVQEGFGIIFTGNVNPPSGPLAKRYVGRHEFDSAFIDRVPNVSYERLPQTVQGEARAAKPEEKQLFTVAVTTALLPVDTQTEGVVEKLESRYGTLFLPGGAQEGLDTLWRFTKFAAVTQKAFDGEIGDGDAFGFASGGNSVGYVPKIQLSNRAMMRVIEQWCDDGFQYELDYYVAKDLFSRAQDPKDRAYLYQKLQFFGFCQSEGWDTNPDYSPNAVLNFRVDIVKNDAAPRGLVPARAVIEAVYGEVPARTQWPDGVEGEAQVEQNAMAELASMEAELGRWKAKNRDYLLALTETHNLIDR